MTPSIPHPTGIAASWQALHICDSSLAIVRRRNPVHADWTPALRSSDQLGHRRTNRSAHAVSGTSPWTSVSILQGIVLGHHPQLAVDEGGWFPSAAMASSKF